MVSAAEKNKRTIHTAGCIIIGDEVLGGKVRYATTLRHSELGNCRADLQQTVDTNSAYFAKWCFSLGINLKRIEVIADDEGEIVEAVKRMSDNYGE